jgi:ABC-type antimicrobial peptide transport system permease subunit
VRTAGEAASAVGAIREELRQIDPNLPMMNVSTQVEQIEQRLQQERVSAQAYTLFGMMALLLASIGLFGLMSYSVARRTNEIGIRMALGAQTQDVLTLVLRESLILIGIGVAIGLGAAIGANRLAASLVFGLATTDPLTIAISVTVMIAVAMIASYVPARRAASVDPLVALRYE